MNDIPASAHTHPTIAGMDDPAITEFVSGIRDRRMRLNAMYLEVQRVRKETDSGKAHAQIDKQLVHFQKAIANIDKAVEKAMLYANKVIALQLQLGTDTQFATRLIAILKGEDK